IVAAYEKGIDDAALFGFDLVRPVQLEISFEMLCCHRRYEDPVRLAGGFVAGGDVDGVSPYIVCEFSSADHACHDRPEWTPTRIGHGPRRLDCRRCAAVTRSNSSLAAIRARLGRGAGNPPAA